MKKRIFALIIASLMMLTMVASTAYAYTLSRPLCHYSASYGGYVLVWQSYHLNHAGDYWAGWSGSYWYC
jgi:hypothetical protein